MIVVVVVVDVVVVVVVVVRDEFLPNGRKAEPFSWRGFAPHGRLARQTLSNWGRPKPSTAWISQGHLTIARGASAWIPTHNRTARLTSTTVQHTWRSVKGTKKKPDTTGAMTTCPTYHSHVYGAD